MADEDTDDEVVPADARNYVMARLAACRVALSGATEAVDETISLFVEPEDDPEGKVRAEFLEGIDELVGDAARAVQAAQELMDSIDPAEGEEELPEGDGHDEDEDGEED